MGENIKLLNELLENVDELNPETIKLLADPYKKLIYSGLAYLFNCYKDLLDNDEYFKIKAKMVQKELNAYIEIGLSREEAFQIVLANKSNYYSNLKNSTGKSNK